MARLRETGLCRRRSGVSGVAAAAALCLAACGTGSAPRHIAASGSSAQHVATPAGACRPLRIPAPTISTPPRSDSPVPGYALARGARPVGVAVGGQSVWVAETGPSKLGRLDPDGRLTEYQVPSSRLGFNLAVGPDGRVWTTESYRSAIAAIAPDGTVVECQLPKGADPASVAVAQDGTVWVAESAAGAVARMRPGGTFETFKLPQEGLQPTELALVGDGAYVSEFVGASFAHVSGDGQVTEASLGDTRKAQSIGIVSSPDGAIWIAEFGADRVVRVSGGTVQPYPLETGSKPQSMALTTSGRLLVTASGVNRIDSIDPATGQVTAVATTGAWPDHIALAADGTVWFSEYYNDRLARLP